MTLNGLWKLGRMEHQNLEDENCRLDRKGILKVKHNLLLCSKDWNHLELCSVLIEKKGIHGMRTLMGRNKTVDSAG